MGLSSCTKEVSQAAGCEFPSRYRMDLVWSDEFETGNDSLVDTLAWAFDLGDGCDSAAINCHWGRNEQQFYTSRPENVRLESGNLIITARREIPLFEGELYTSARLVTRDKRNFKYGRVDVRAKLPSGIGLWPAIWMLPVDTVYGAGAQSGEIAIMECAAANTSEIFTTVEYADTSGMTNSIVEPFSYAETDSIDFAEDFHTYSVIWTEDCILFQVDDIDVATPITRSTLLPSSWPFDQEFYLIINLAIGGNGQGSIPFQTQLPQDMVIDYVRIYQ